MAYGRPAWRQATVNGSARAGAMPTAAQNSRALKEGCRANTCIAAALAASARPSLASAAASKM